MKAINRRSFMRIAGMSLGAGALYQVLPVKLNAESNEIFNWMGDKNGERPAPFSFVQLSDTHVGFNGPPNPLGTKAFERAVEIVNKLPQRPDLVLFTGDLTHDSEDKDVHAARMKMFQQISSQLHVPVIKCVPGEHDAGLDGGQLFRESFGETTYSFDHKGVHFVALDNVSRAKPEVGAERIAWLKRDVARFSKTTPIVVFTHRPLFDLRPEWEWFTSDGDEVMNLLAPYENVTVLYGHIHRDHEHEEGHTRHYAARSLIFAFPDPESTPEKKPLPFDKDHPFSNLGLRVIGENGRGEASVRKVELGEVELSLREFSGTEGIQQILKTGVMK
jgi:3',5'-cyclic AMP phosphodiesterase CpdA